MVAERRRHTEDPDEELELSSEELLAMDEMQLMQLLTHLGITPPQPPVRDKMLELVMRVAQGARDS